MRKCGHGVYWPDGDKVALSCQLCNPGGIASTVETTPVFNRRGAMLLATGRLPKCPVDGTLLAVSRGGLCITCGGKFEIMAAENMRANNTQPGVCPACGSGIHYEGKNRRVWACADCGTEYKAPKVRH